ncbi:hypothetical protein CSKR_112355 [Clonorchis sinensis]|uniref:Homeobox domain-containing protein n=1 Tax=Clonorchis sinensis TaxID=79923 RepID=A0A8T1MD09_CLOSI|nr:hypothetical protein CSKR_112355 [Clonorchis sinensis]
MVIQSHSIMDIQRMAKPSFAKTDKLAPSFRINDILASTAAAKQTDNELPTLPQVQTNLSAVPQLDPQLWAQLPSYLTKTPSLVSTFLLGLSNILLGTNEESINKRFDNSVLAQMKHGDILSRLINLRASNHCNSPADADYNGTASPKRHSDSTSSESLCPSKAKECSRYTQRYLSLRDTQSLPVSTYDPKAVELSLERNPLLSKGITEYGRISAFTNVIQHSGRSSDYDNINLTTTSSKPSSPYSTESEQQWIAFGPLENPDDCQVDDESDGGLQEQQQQQQQQQQTANSALDALIHMTTSSMQQLHRRSTVPADVTTHLGISCINRGTRIAKRRKTRTTFSNSQLTELEHNFNRQKYLTPTDRDRIAKTLGLSNTQVITWFQNRRAKLKREAEELERDVLAARQQEQQKIFEKVSQCTNSNNSTADNWKVLKDLERGMWSANLDLSYAMGVDSAATLNQWSRHFERNTKANNLSRTPDLLHSRSHSHDRHKEVLVQSISLSYATDSKSTDARVPGEVSSKKLLWSPAEEIEDEVG